MSKKDRYDKKHATEKQFNSSDSQNLNDQRKSEETVKSFEDSAATDQTVKNEPVKEAKEFEKEYNKNEFGDFNKVEEDNSENTTNMDHEDSREAHLDRLRKAMRMIEEEIRHIELRSENIA